jgi:protein O-mannosyl-transferase
VKRGILLTCILLALAVGVVYCRVASFPFVTLDDPYYIYENPMVSQGLSVQGVLWGWTTDYFDCWHPVTWWSHMIDCQVFGLRAGWHHLENVAIHITNTLLVFVVLRRMTGSQARSAIVAALFGLHPTHVESVAWAAERKDVLSTFFWLLAVWAYVGYARDESEPNVHGPKPRMVDVKAESAGLASNRKCRVLWYILSLMFFALGLMSKPMVVTLPCVLLLLDYWPLRRISNPSSATSNDRVLPLLVEKAPFFALAFVSSAVTFFGMRSGYNLVGRDHISWELRLTNVPISYIRYLGKLFWPAGLIPYYPLPDHWPAVLVAGAIALLCLITVMVLTAGRRAPYVFVGWLFFLGTLVPVIGVVAMSYQAMADRYLYVPSLGIFIGVVWSVADVSALWRLRLLRLGSGTALVLAALAFQTSRQVQTWHDTTTLWTHCLEVSPRNSFGQYGMGCLLQNSGHPAEARDHFLEAVRLQPDHFFANLDLGVAYASLGRYQEATNWFARAMAIRPHYGKAPANMGAALFVLGDSAGALTNYQEALTLDAADIPSLIGEGRTLSSLGRSDEALRCYLNALQQAPTNNTARYHLGLEYLKRGELGQAVAMLKQVIGTGPESAPPHLYLASALQKQHETGEALEHYREAIRIDPTLPAARNNLAWILATHPQAEFRNGREAVRLAQAACEQTQYHETVLVGTLAAAYAEAGQFDQAAATAQKACDLAAASGQTNLLARNQKLLHQFQNHEPCRDVD